MSKSNKYEAAFLAALCRHLILQGYAPSEITVLTTYTGQMFLLKKEISTFNSCNGVRVTVVDNYQGEENKIILLSLVRSNAENNIGFLKTDNRICVAISRAKYSSFLVNYTSTNITLNPRATIPHKSLHCCHILSNAFTLFFRQGLYIIGNMKNLTAQSSTWMQIQKKLLSRNEIGRELHLRCERHENIINIQNPKDFLSKSPDGGCQFMCKFLLPCTHACEQICHPSDREHRLYLCMKSCLRSCPSEHACLARCHMPCPLCTVTMERKLPCQHVLKLPCHKDPTTVYCMVIVEKEKPCAHKEKMACFKEPSEVKCRELIQKRLPCAHVKAVECVVDPSTVTCKVNVIKVLEPCGHEQIEECHKQPSMISCETEVQEEFPDCRHKVSL